MLALNSCLNFMTVEKTNEQLLHVAPEQKDTHSPKDQAGTSKSSTDEQFHRQYGCYKIIYLTRMAACILTLTA